MRRSYSLKPETRDLFNYHIASIYIEFQRNQIKEIIYSLLPACKEPDMDSGIPFKADAVIANPPAYGLLSFG